MNIEAIQALGLQDEVAPPWRGAPGAPSGVGFLQQVGQGLQQLNEQLLGTQADLQHLAVGDVENLHGLMIRLEESRIALQLALQVRTRVLEAYQDVMRMQI